MRCCYHFAASDARVHRGPQGMAKRSGGCCTRDSGHASLLQSLMICGADARLPEPPGHPQLPLISTGGAVSHLRGCDLF